MQGNKGFAMEKQNHTPRKPPPHHQPPPQAAPANGQQINSQSEWPGRDGGAAWGLREAPLRSAPEWTRGRAGRSVLGIAIRGLSSAKAPRSPSRLCPAVRGGGERAASGEAKCCLAEGGLYWVSLRLPPPTWVSNWELVSARQSCSYFGS